MKFLKIISLMVVFVLCIMAFSGCTLFEKDYPVDVAGVTVNKMPERVAALSQSAASSISALGYGEYLVGAPSAFLTGEETGIVDLGNPLMPNEEALLELSPDVLVVSEALTTDLMDRLALRGVTVITLKTPTQYSEVAPYYTELSKLFIGKKKYLETADPFNASMENSLSELKASNAAITKSVVVFIDGDFVATGDTLAGQALAKAGIKNIAESSTDYVMTTENIATANPDVIFCSSGMSNAILTNEAYKEINAIKNAAVYEVDVFALSFAGDGFIAALQDMSTYLKQ